jgi:signal transduction histidine kinase
MIRRVFGAESNLGSIHSQFGRGLGMARAISPEPRQASSNRWTAVAGNLMRSKTAFMRRLRPLAARRPALAQLISTFYLAALAIMVLTAWQTPAQPSSAAAGPALGELHLFLLLSIGSILALTTLAGGGRPSGQSAALAETSPAGAGELLAHMSHALRTPLNAVIGFSQVMAGELHGPLGNSRYQEYANHICESGERLLKSSEDALAVTEAIAALMTDHSRGHRQRLPLVTLIGEAWRGAAGADAAAPVVAEGTGLSISCERRAMRQALEHLIRHATSLAPAESIKLTAAAEARGGLMLRLEAACAPNAAGGAELHLIMARLLLETQGARLACGRANALWSASIVWCRD